MLIIFGGRIWKEVVAAPVEPEASDNFVLTWFPQEKGAAWIWVGSGDYIVDPRIEGRVSLKFTVAATNPEGLHLVLGGPYVEGANCYSDQDIDKSAHDYASLSEPIQELADVYLSLAPYHGWTRVAEGDQRRELDDARALSRGQFYLDIELKSFYDWESSVSEGELAGEELHAEVAVVVCSFEREHLWSTGYGTSVFTTPGVLARADFAEQPNYVYAASGASLVNDPEAEIRYSTYGTDYSDPTEVSITGSWSAWDYSEPTTISLSAASVAFSEPDTESFRASAYLWFGAIISLAIGIATYWLDSFFGKGGEGA